MVQPFLCIITPIFDPALEPAKLLINDLQNQSLGDFIHVLISNGESPQTKQFIQELQDSRFIYDEIPFQPISTSRKAAGRRAMVRDLICNIGQRREYCLKEYNCQRYLFLNADLKILDGDYFQKLFQAHLEADVLVTQLLNQPNGIRGSVLPKYPITIGKIDIANFSFSQKVAKERSWPIDYHPLFGIANDYRFFSELVGRFSIKFLSFVSSEKDGHNNQSYQQISQM